MKFINKVIEIMFVNNNVWTQLEKLTQTLELIF